MYITYHREVELNGKTIKFPHNCLAKEIQDFIELKTAKQYFYEVKTSNSYLFIYLINGDRVDVQL